MKWNVTHLILLAVLVACRQGPAAPAPSDAGSPATTPTAAATDTPIPTPTPIPGGADRVGLAFMKAWEAGDYLGMYSQLAPQSQALVDSQSFVNRYQEALQTAHVFTVRSQPLSAMQNGDRAEFAVRVTWVSPIIGDIVRELEVPLVYSQGRWGVVWDEGLILPELAGGNRLSMEFRIPARANIYDVNGKALAYQGTAVTLGVVPGRIEDEEGLLRAISPLLGKTEDEVREMYASALPDWYVPLGDIPGDVMQDKLLELQPFLNAGLLADDRLSRLYPENGVAPHIVGYMGFISPEQLDDYLAQGYRGDELVGRAGVEAWGERYLSGSNGGLLGLLGPNGEYLGPVQESEPRQPRSVYTTISHDYQRAVEQALADAIESHPLAQAGAAVVLDVHSGAVLAMASYPRYNPAVFDNVRPNSEVELRLVLNNPGQPLLNRAVQGQYPPGSLFKVVTLSAGLDSGLYTFESRYTSTGAFTRLPGISMSDWREGGHGNISYRTALIESCNSCFFDMGYELYLADPFLAPNTARQFGLGVPTGIQGLPEGSEASGLIPDPDWKLATGRGGWVPGDSVNMATGQGDVLVTPLQVANIMAALANGGTLYRPTVINRIGAGGGAPEEMWPTEVIGQLPLSPENLAGIQEALLAVTTASDGTATHRFTGLRVPVAGKTGTAENAGSEPHAWFAGYAPAAPYTQPDGTVIEQPQIAIAVVVENAGEGSAVAAPIVRRLVELYFGITPLKPYPWAGSNG